jgi:uncharacterized membrane protein YhaH (DUF805 family)
LGDVWVDPKAGAVRRVVDVWWSRWFALVVLPALLVRFPFCFSLSFLLIFPSLFYIFSFLPSSFFPSSPFSFFFNQGVEPHGAAA